MTRRLLLIILICLAQGFIFLQVSGVIREDKIAELQIHLKDVSFLQNSDSLLNITGRLTLIRNRLEAGESPIDNYQNEARMQSLTSGMILYNKAETEDESDQIKRSALSLFTERLMGRDRPEEDLEPEYFTHLEEAYYWERNRHYGLAVDKYRFLLSEYSEELKVPVRETILLHLSFSHLMNADYSEAERIAENIINESSNIIFRITADRINTFLFSLKKKQQQLALLEENSLELGREQYFSVKYREASATLENFLTAGDLDLDEESEARYYLARAYEELGNTEDSISEYQRILLLSADRNIVLEAGRRLLMLDSFYDISEEETEILKETLEDYDDPEMTMILAPFKELYEEPRITPDYPESTENGEALSQDETNQQPTGEIYITTTPPGALISVNGINFGISPLFITSLPVGNVEVRAEYEERSVVSDIEVSSRIIRKISLELPSAVREVAPVLQPEPKGQLLINHNLTDVSMELNYETVEWINGEAMPLDPGQYIIIITGRDESGKLLFWEEEVLIESGKTSELTIDN